MPNSDGVVWTIPPSVLDDAEQAQKAGIQVRDREAFEKWLLLNKKRQTLDWWLRNPEPRRSVPGALVWWTLAKRSGSGGRTGSASSGSGSG